MAHRGAAGGLWAWSLDFYARPGVAAACLELQDRCTADVNLLLLGLWLATTERQPDAAATAAVSSYSAAWQREVVAPLRAARRALKEIAGRDAGLEALRRQVAAVELEAERLQQAELERLVHGAATAPGGSATAVAIWRHLLGTHRLDRQPARHLLASAFPQETAATRDAALARLG